MRAYMSTVWRDEDYADMAYLLSTDPLYAMDAGHNAEEEARAILADTESGGFPVPVSDPWRGGILREALADALRAFVEA